jgi:hypothetical protein
LKATFQPRRKMAIGKIARADGCKPLSGTFAGVVTKSWKVSTGDDIPSSLVLHVGSPPLPLFAMNHRLENQA